MRNVPVQVNVWYDQGLLLYKYNIYWLYVHMAKDASVPPPNEYMPTQLDYTKHNYNKYHIYPKYSERQTWANSVDPDQTPKNLVSNQGLH